MLPFWMRVEMKKEKIMIIDCGYITDQAARDRVDQILALGIGKNNLATGPSTGPPRLHIHIPKSKVKKIMESLPISGKTWYGATHSYLSN